MTGPAGVPLRLPAALRELAGGRREVIVEVTPGCAVGEVLDELRQTLPALERRIRDERGQLRRHVNVFVGADNVRDLAMLATRVPPGAEMHVIPSVSGGST